METGNRILIDESLHFKQVVAEASQMLKSSSEIILDFSMVSYVPSSIIGAILAITDRVQSLGGAVKLENLSKDVVDQLHSIGLSNLL